MGECGLMPGIIRLSGALYASLFLALEKKVKIQA